MGLQLSRPLELQNLIDLKQNLSIYHRYSNIEELYKYDLMIVSLYLCKLPDPQEGAPRVTVISNPYVILGYSEGRFCLVTYQDSNSGGYCPIQEVELSGLIDHDRVALEKFVPENDESYGYCFPSIAALNDKIEELKEELRQSLPLMPTVD